jgi:predicted SnoaL-like aldol condensation-catalyzing enzyme
MDISKDEYINKLEGLIKYQEAFDILMEHWDSIPDEEKPKIDKRFKELGL